jgi:ADP-heptose:LPS heptosyltransferase
VIRSPNQVLDTNSFASTDGELLPKRPNIRQITENFFFGLARPWVDFFARQFVGSRDAGLSLVRVDGIGDFVLWLPSAKLLCQHYSGIGKPNLICDQTCVDLAVATGWFGNVIGVDHLSGRFGRDLAYRWAKLREVASLGSSIAIQPTFSRVFLGGDTLIRACRAATRIGSVGDYNNVKPWQKAISDRWYTKLVDASPQPMMELERNAEFLRNLGLADARAEIPVIPRLTDLPPDKSVSGDYFVLFPGASSPIKRWPAEGFVAVANLIAEKYGWIPVACGGRSELELCERVLEGVNRPGQNFAGMTTLPELAEIIRKARLVVTNDTSAIHIAAGVDTPSVCILGGGHYGRFLPYPDDVKGRKPIPVIKQMDCFGCSWQCLFTQDRTRPFPCVKDIELEQVVTAVSVATNQSDGGHGQSD